ncbi:hypothetical protein M9H77_14634 [Catharanthus roseus]|uniref:Uncharacterized protein n=1 Tax=Catharanthus roseus TaxID=4058 RepID=A0ACC0BNL5_CATRO|nr:hypothetical protein M9H77_14634 [Catharanthus roseus]
MLTHIPCALSTSQIYLTLVVVFIFFFSPLHFPPPLQCKPPSLSISAPFQPFPLLFLLIIFLSSFSSSRSHRSNTVAEAPSPFDSTTFRLVLPSGSARCFDSIVNFLFILKAVLCCMITRTLIMLKHHWKAAKSCYNIWKSNLDRHVYLDPLPPLGAIWCTSFDLNQLSTHVLLTYRDQLNFMPSDHFAAQFVWLPYLDRGLVPSDLRQTELVPAACDALLDLHRLQLRRNDHTYWASQHTSHVEVCHQGRQHIRDGLVLPIEDLSSPRDDYIKWYRDVLRVYIGNPARRNTRSIGYQSAGLDRRMMIGRAPIPPHLSRQGGHVDPGHRGEGGGGSGGRGREDPRFDISGDPFDSPNLDALTFSLGLTPPIQSHQSRSGTSYVPLSNEHGGEPTDDITPAQQLRFGLVLIQSQTFLEVQHTNVSIEEDHPNITQHVTAITQMISNEPSMLYPSIEEDNDENDDAHEDYVVSSEFEDDNNDNDEEDDISTPVNPLSSAAVNQ